MVKDLLITALLFTSVIGLMVLLAPFAPVVVGMLVLIAVLVAVYFLRQLIAPLVIVGGLLYLIWTLVTTVELPGLDRIPLTGAEWLLLVPIAAAVAVAVGYLLRSSQSFMAGYHRARNNEGDGGGDRETYFVRDELREEGEADAAPDPPRDEKSTSPPELEPEYDRIDPVHLD